MNLAQVHLLVNHFPVILPLVGGAILLCGLVIKSPTVQKVGLWVFVACALATVPAYFTGEPAEKIVKNYPGVMRKIIHQHQDAAFIAFVGIEVVGFLSTLLLVWMMKTKRSIPGYLWMLFMILAGASFLIVAQAAHLGGQIRHEEIQTAAQILQH
jgi:uncharacterized membrane protein